MSAVQPFVRTTIGSTLRVIEELQRDVYWIHMHADLAINPGRACFSSRLVDDITGYQVEPRPAPSPCRCDVPTRGVGIGQRRFQPWR